MVFIVMTGVAAGILFILSSWLQKMITEKQVEA
jgi:POT family proton-dependent oligopeptide transporter